MDVCIYVGTYVCIYVCTYICIYLYKDTDWTVRSSSPGRGKMLLSPPKVQTGSGAQPASVYFPRTKWQGRDVNHPLPSSVEVKIEWSCSFAPLIYLHGVYRTVLSFLLSYSLSNDWLIKKKFAAEFSNLTVITKFLFISL